MRLVCMRPCVPELREAHSKHMKASHHQRPSARIREVDLDTCHAGSEEAPVGDTIGAWAGGDGCSKRMCS
jgi:hypothetical protein